MSTTVNSRLRVGIAIDLSEWPALMREFLDDMAVDTDLKTTMEWTMENFLQWAKRKRSAPYKERSNGPCSACGDGDMAMKYHNHDDDNILTFRVEKEGVNR